MNTRIVMTASAFLLALLGLSLTFLPQEVAGALALGGGAATQLVLSLLGALYLGFAMLNWMAKGSLMGGIYNRPIAIANFTHFFIGALALVKAEGDLAPAAWGLMGVYAVLALAFGIILFRHPLKPETKA
ncbi:hypothetical protein [Rufibacter psychrotolerans]|uniref:hypothetical protein n=1 Tax=Rufibacter psychrotolerans TaxID=2812556 RepID=UPI00196823D7|nr:hypothetical protein [Rufibacter sp. SYSU D00308]